MLKRIHVNQHNIRKNKKDCGKQKLPVITVKTYKENIYANEVEILGPCRIVYSGYNGKKPLSCGAQVWIETTSEILLKK